MSQYKVGDKVSLAGAVEKIIGDVVLLQFPDGCFYAKASDIVGPGVPRELAVGWTSLWSWCTDHGMGSLPGDVNPNTHVLAFIKSLHARAESAEAKVRELTTDKCDPGPRPGPDVEVTIQPGDWIAFAPEGGPVVYGQVTHILPRDPQPAQQYDRIYTSAGMTSRCGVLEVRR